MSTTFTMRMDEGQKTLISEYAKAQGKPMTQFILDTVMDAIEDAIDLHDWNEAYKEYQADPTVYSHDEIMQEFGLR